MRGCRDGSACSRTTPRWAEPGPRVMLAGAAGVLLMLIFAIWYGLSVSMAPHDVYVPAQLGPDGRVIPGRVDQAR